MDTTDTIEILNDWNFWNKPLPDTFDRESYDTKISKFLNNDEVVVISGVRRSGKSTLMINQIKQLIDQGVNVQEILFINFEDPRLINHLSLDLLQQIKDVYLEYLNPSSKPYIFLDEIQNIPHWEKWVNKEYELKKSHLMVTGSNSAMLSSEIATVLSGRYVSVDIYPLSFKEFLVFKKIVITSKLELISKKIELNREFDQFLKNGGFPKLVGYDQDDKRELLTTYKNSILLKDIVARFKLKNFTVLEDIAAFLISNTGIIQSITKLKNNFSTSFDMASDYVSYLKKAHIIYEINKFDYSLKKQRVNDKKYYSIDLGLSNLMRVPNLKSRGNDLETIVFLELKRRGMKVYYYKSKNGLEIDFLVEKNNQIIELIQVSKSIKNKDTLKRELVPFKIAEQELQLNQVKKLVITEDNDNDLDDVQIVNIKTWLLS